MRLICAGITDVGIARDHNEDAFYLSPQEALCIVADGMGGHRSGEIASNMAIERIKEYYLNTVIDETEIESFKAFRLFRRKKPENIEERRLIQGVLYANKSIFQASADNEDYRGMGTTIVAAYFLEDGAFIAHVGDSRCYRLRKGELVLLTEDHSLANEYIKMGIIDKDDLDSFPYKNVITRALGLSESVEVESHYHTLRDDDIYLFCSDGLTDCVSDKMIAEILVSAPDLATAAGDLVDEANDNGGTDNITVLLTKTVL